MNKKAFVSMLYVKLGKILLGKINPSYDCIAVGYSDDFKHVRILFGVIEIFSQQQEIDIINIAIELSKCLKNAKVDYYIEKIDNNGNVSNNFDFPNKFAIYIRYVG